MNKKRKILNYIFVFSIPVLIILYLCLVEGKSNFINSDLEAQYIYLFYYLKDVLSNSASLEYSFFKGLGGGMIGTFYYYLSSPLNFLVYFVKKSEIHNFITFLILFKIGICSLNMYFYLESKKIKNLYKVILSFSYALMNYNLMYYFNIMYLDVIALAPIVILGLERLIEQDKKTLYMLTLLYCIISNYYLSYMLCLFCLIYFLYRLYINFENYDKKQLFHKIKIFVLASIIPVLLSSFVLIPVLGELLNVKRYPVSHSSILKNISRFLYGLSMIKQDGIIKYEVPNVFSSYFLLILFLLSFSSKKKKVVKANLVVTLIFIFSMLSYVGWYIWHLSIPKLFLHRFCFLLVLFQIIVVSNFLEEKKEITKKQQIVIGGILVGNFIVSRSFIDDNNFLYSLFINIFFIISNLIFIGFVNYKCKTYDIAFIVVVIIGFYNNVNSNFYLNSYKYSYKELQSVCTIIPDSNYRVAGYIDSSLNEMFFCKNSRIAFFWSTNQKNFMKFVTDSGYLKTSTSVFDNKNNFFINTLVGVKYWYERIGNKFIVNKNKDALQLGFMVNYNDISLDNSSVLNYQNSILKALGYDKIFSIKKISQVQLDLIKGKKIYFEKDGVLISNQNYYEKLPIKKKNILINNDFIYAGFLDEEKYNNIINDLKNNQLSNIKISKNYLSGTIEVEDKKILLLTIPYDKNFKVYVDGKESEYSEILDTFIGIPLTEGKHVIKIKYKNKLFRIGIIMSCIFLLILVILKIIVKNVKKNKKY